MQKTKGWKNSQEIGIKVRLIGNSSNINLVCDYKNFIVEYIFVKITCNKSFVNKIITVVVVVVVGAWSLITEDGGVCVSAQSQTTAGCGGLTNNSRCHQLRRTQFRYLQRSDATAYWSASIRDQPISCRDLLTQQY